MEHAPSAVERVPNQFDAMRVSLPPRAVTLTLEWASLHRDELMEDWDLCATRQPPRKIAPLE